MKVENTAVRSRKETYVCRLGHQEHYVHYLSKLSNSMLSSRQTTLPLLTITVYLLDYLCDDNSINCLTRSHNLFIYHPQAYTYDMLFNY